MTGLGGEAGGSGGGKGAGGGGTAGSGGDKGGQKMRAMLRARLGDDVYSSFFTSLEFDGLDGATARLSVAHKFLQNWIKSHYTDALLECARGEFKDVERVEVTLRQPGAAGVRPAAQVGEPARAPGMAEQQASIPDVAAFRAPSVRAPVFQAQSRTEVAGFEGSPLDPRYTFDSFVVGAANRLAHAAATQVAETATSDMRSYNPLYIHSSVGLGKTHLLHAIAWEVRQRAPSTKLLYLTAERFRFQFVDALRSQDAMAFKERFRQTEILLVDDLEFMHGEKTELEFDHIINTLLDGGRQVVVASARAPGQIERLNERMRSRLQRGLVVELGGLDRELRVRVLERRVMEKQAIDPTFDLPRDVIDLLSEKLTESGRELEGAVTRLHHTWQNVRQPLSIDIVETVIRDLVQGIEPRRIKIEDIMRIVSRHFGVSKGDLISQRRHRSVVWPRQIGMYLAKQLTSRSLPEIGRRFGGRDHTTVLHAIRKIESDLTGNSRLREELDELKKMLNH